MRLPWHRERVPAEHRQEADAALSESQERYEQAKARGPEVSAMARRLREIRQENHFSELLRSLAEGGHHAHDG